MPLAFAGARALTLGVSQDRAGNGDCSAVAHAMRLSWLVIPLVFPLLFGACRERMLDPDGGTGVILGRAGNSGAGGAAGVVGSAGFSGRAGISGAVGRGATGGATCTFGGITLTRPDNCGAAVCGNGVRDTCTWDSACGAMTIAEYCDGLDMGGSSCSQRGYASGPIGCSVDCTLDLSACSECMTAIGVRCADAPVTITELVEDRLALRLAATDDEVALLWVQHDRLNTPTVQLARLTPDLQLLGSTRIDDARLGYSSAIWPAMGVAASPSGWIVVNYGGT